MREMADRFAGHPAGCEYGYEADIADIVPGGLACPHCGGTRWKRETDILDVWFDSGTSFAAVLEQRPELRFPADMYLEGSDQHRGWFHSSLLACAGTRGGAPYKAVLTHGYVVDGEGRKMSKSVGNVIAPQELIAKFGSEIVRLWVSSVDYREDIRISDQILNRLVDAYRRIRNTCRFILGNLADMTPQALVPLEKLTPLDRFALDAAARVHERVQEAYAEFEFHKVYHSLHNYCVTDLSAVYLDIAKDRLYTESADGPLRRSAQTALWHILSFLIRDMAPVLSFTAEEIFGHIPASLRSGEKTVFALPPLAPAGFMLDAQSRQNWDSLLAARGVVTGAIEVLRRDGGVGHSLDTRVTLYVSAPLERKIRTLNTDLCAFCIVSQLRTAPLADAPAAAFVDPEVEGVAVVVEKALGDKCERCWMYSAELGADAGHPTLCPRCAAVLKDCDGAAR
jgi:isoleucyl-tRNA synthetase